MASGIVSSIVRGVIAFPLAALTSLAIVAVGQGLWQPLVIANMRLHPEIPWAAPTMALLLGGLLCYLSGRGWPPRTQARRRALFRWNGMPMPVFVLAVGAGMLGLVAFGGLWIAVSDLTALPPGIQPRITGVPPPTVISFLLMSALAAPLTEEAAFRGYAMGMLQKAWGWTPAALIGSTILFAAVHVTQGLDPVKLGLYFAAGLIFAMVAHLTSSLYPAMVVHSVGDVMGFTLLWPHDQTPHGMGFDDPIFAPALAVAVVLTPLAILAFLRLADAGRDLRQANDAVGTEVFPT